MAGKYEHVFNYYGTIQSTIWTKVFMSRLYPGDSSQRRYQKQVFRQIGYVGVHCANLKMTTCPKLCVWIQSG